MMESEYFFFQAEDGIRDGRVTGVQTCALPISIQPVRPHQGVAARVESVGLGVVEGHDLHLQRPAREVAALDRVERSEERRVGKECRSRWWAEHEKGKKSKMWAMQRVDVEKGER